MEPIEPIEPIESMESIKARGLLFQFSKHF